MTTDITKIDLFLIKTVHLARKQKVFELNIQLSEYTGVGTGRLHSVRLGCKQRSFSRFTDSSFGNIRGISSLGKILHKLFLIWISEKSAWNLWAQRVISPKINLKTLTINPKFRANYTPLLAGSRQQYGLEKTQKIDTGDCF